jgi:F-type H+-transporting ATPase subunit b
VLLRLSILAAEATGAAAEEEVTNPIIPEAKEILWAFVFVALLYLAMRYMLVPPLQRMMKERDDKIRADLEAADTTTAGLATVQAEYDAALAAAREEGNELIAAARAEAEAHQAALQAQADVEIAELRRQAQTEIVAAREQALASMRGDVVDLAVTAASAVLQAPVDRAAAGAVVERALSTNGRTN